MIVAHQSSSLWDKMVQLGVVHVLLEVALLGSPLAQKRAIKLWNANEEDPHWGPQCPRTIMSSSLIERETKERKRMMKNLVKESLHRNVERITQKIKAVEESSKLKYLFISASSRS